MDPFETHLRIARRGSRPPGWGGHALMVWTGLAKLPGRRTGTSNALMIGKSRKHLVSVLVQG